MPITEGWRAIETLYSTPAPAHGDWPRQAIEDVAGELGVLPWICDRLLPALEGYIDAQRSG